MPTQTLENKHEMSISPPWNNLISWGLTQSKVFENTSHDPYLQENSQNLQPRKEKIYYELQTSTKVRYGGVAGKDAQCCKRVPGS